MTRGRQTGTDGAAPAIRLDKLSRTLASDDRTRILRALQQHKPGDFEALRTRALILVALGSGLRVSELVALDVDGVEEHRGIQLAPQLREGVKFPIPFDARAALRAYITEGRRRGHIGADGPLFVAHKRNKHTAPKYERTTADAKAHGAGYGPRPRLTSRMAMYGLKRVQHRAGVAPPYRFQDIRHDALTRFAKLPNPNPGRGYTSADMLVQRAADTELKRTG